MEFSEFREEWRVVIGTFFVCFLTDGFMFQFGLFLVELIEEFESSRATTAFIGSIGIGVFYVLGPISGSLADTYGSRRLVITGTLISFAGFMSGAFAKSIPILYITYGLFGGIGCGLLWVPANACLMKHFTKSRALASGFAASGTGIGFSLLLVPANAILMKHFTKCRALASGIAASGTGFGTFAFSKLVSYLISEYGWRMTLFIMSGVVLNGIPCGLLLVRKKTTESIQNENPKQKSELSFTNRKEWTKSILKSSLRGARNTVEENRQLLTNKSFVFFMISTFFVGLGFSVPYSILPDHAAQMGMSKSDASWLVSSIGVSTTIGRFLFGWLGDQFSKYRRVMFDVMVLVQGLSIAAIPAMATFETKLIPTCSFALAYGCYFTSLAVVLADEFGQNESGKTLGLNFFALGISTFVAAPLAGGIYDVSNNYSISFYVAGGNLCLASLWLLVPRKILAFKEKQKNNFSLPHINSI